MAVEIGPALGLTADSKSLVVATEELRDLATAAKQAQGAAQGFVAGADKMTVAASRVAETTEDAALAARNLGPGMAAGGSNARMLAQQLSQVAQQASATGNFTQALAIQLPDMAMGLGAVGIAAGVLASVALPALVGWLGNTGAQATAATEALRALNEAQIQTQAEIDKLRFGVAESFQVDLLNEKLRLEGEYAAKLAERERIAKTIINDERTLNVFLADSNAELQVIVDRHREIVSAIAQQQNRAAQLSIIEGIRVQQANEIKAKQEETAREIAKVEARLRAAGVSAETLAQLNFANIDQARAYAEGLEGAMRSAAAYAKELSVTGQSSGPDSARTLVQFGGPVAMQPSGAGLPYTPPSGIGGGGGGGTNQRQTQLEMLIESLRTEQETVEVWRAEQLELLAQYSDAELAAIGGANEAKLRLEEEYQERLRGIREGANGGALADAASFFGGMAEVARAGGEKTLKITQALAATQGVINSYLAFTEVPKDPAFIGRPWARAGAAAAALAQGLSAVASIRSASSGGARTGAGRGATPSTAAAPSSPVSVAIQGLNPGDLYSGASVIGLVDAVQKELKNRGAIISFV